ncbi:hypothetical protein NUACC26_036980 [Scytonema sp. NUACC26]
MRIAPEDRARVKAECLRLLATLRLDPARTKLISGFVDTYLELNASEEQVFQRELDSMGLRQEEQVMEIVTSWMKTGMQQEAQKLVLRQLNGRLGTIEPSLEQRVRELPLDQTEALSEALLDFVEISDLVNWLEQTRS